MQIFLQRVGSAEITGMLCRDSQLHIHFSKKLKLFPDFRNLQNASKVCMIQGKTNRRSAAKTEGAQMKPGIIQTDRRKPK